MNNEGDHNEPNLADSTIHYKSLMFPCEQQPPLFKRQKKWIWNFNAHQTPINLAPSQSHTVTITHSPLFAKRQTREKHSPQSAWQHTLSSATKPFSQPAYTHNTTHTILKFFLERESERREKVADPPWPPPRNVKTSSTSPSSPNKPNAMKV